MLLAAPVQAQTPKPAPARIAPDAATSRCLGAPTTPACAAETLLACLARGDAALCRAVGTTAPPRAAEPVQVEYVMERVSIIRPEDVTEDLREVEWFKPGYALVEAQRRLCPASAGTCEGESWDYLQVYLRQRPDAAAPGWEIVHWRSESEPDVPQEIPDEPEKKSPRSEEHTSELQSH